MTGELRHVRQKWRPSVRLILLVLNLTILMLPIAGLQFFRIYENQLVRETERELIAQAAVIAPVFKRALKRELADEFKNHGRPVETHPGAGLDKRFTPVLPNLDLATSPVLPPRPYGELQETAIKPALRIAALATSMVFSETQMVTLAGLRILDPNGIVIGASVDAGFSFSGIDEIRTALSGRYASAIRQRFSDSPLPALTSISRSARVRAFIAFPVVEDQKLLGIIYMSRTPDNVWRRLYAARASVVLAVIVLLTITIALALVTSRTILAPVDALNRLAADVAGGRYETATQIKRAGTREMAHLANSIVDMANALNRRSQYIREFAVTVGHEFKTPVTAIQGASELLLDDDGTMSSDDRKRFVSNIRDDAQRITQLISRLNDLARAENPLQSDEITNVRDVLERFITRNASIELDTGLAGETNAQVRMPADALEIIASNLIVNAAQAGATTLAISISKNDNSAAISFTDNGPGIATADRDRIFDAFHTTRRDQGGTGLGLRIVRSLLEAYGGSIELTDAPEGTCFILRLPLTTA